MHRVIKQLCLCILLLGTLPGVHAASAIAIAAAGDGKGINYGWEDHGKTLEAANRSAIAECVDSSRKRGDSGDNCHVVISKATAGYWAIFGESNGQIAVGYSQTSQQAATDLAYSHCGANMCGNTAAHVWYDNGKGTLPAGSSGGSYTISCNGAQCTRRYASGKVIHFTACMNPSTHQPFDNPDGSCFGIDMSNHSLND
jgi:hypothetical protein